MTFIDAHRDRFGVEPICRTLGLAPSTYYARKTRPPSRRAIEDARLLKRIQIVHEHNYRAYGSRRVWKALRRQGVPVSRCRVERLMRAHGLRGAQPGRKRRRLTVADETAPRPADLVERRFVADRPNELWVCDLTYLKTREGFLYLAFVKDVFSRMIVGWQTATHLRTDLVPRRARDGRAPTLPRRRRARRSHRPRQPVHELSLHATARRPRHRRLRRLGRRRL
jgi:putative transposase